MFNFAALAATTVMFLAALPHGALAGEWPENSCKSEVKTTDDKAACVKANSGTSFSYCQDHKGRGRKNATVASTNERMPLSHVYRDCPP